MPRDTFLYVSTNSGYMAASDMVCVKKELLERLIDWLLALLTKTKEKDIIKSPQICEHTEMIIFWVREYEFV